MKRSIMLQWLSLLLPVGLLAGCGDSGEQEVRQWMNETRSQARISVPKITEPKKFTPFLYSQKGEIDPFDPIKLQVALARQQKTSSSKLRPNLERRREALEAYPLDGLKMVGTLQSREMRLALIEVDKLVYQVKIGNYMGQNFGMVTRITDNDVEIKEVIQDAGGEWIERKAKLELQETKK
ncbi:pilus assembly protein PilP [Lacisediminimonas sp.]|uniref:pilus assembly protein PilP n=1 Tax=Lacisediminimonas sp. TaxID=3060582 RepID=UPI00271B9497|nr:pilus assembly protein PilP [Lacisediminimonas sp.]MDO8299890.1 pilus assembly protein PilP [Lacisediminimonas sp.]MDO9218750.1 pilus assembly protein PilP [Lacisediminimonas sp.]